jgi:putative oxidoreductase
MILHRLDRYRDSGLLILRIGIGISLMFHGTPKLFGGPDTWAAIGGSMHLVGINFLPGFWGFMAAVSEFIGGLLLVAGLLFRPALILLLCTMIVAIAHHIAEGDKFGVASHPIELAVLFFSLIFIGPGRYNLDEKLATRTKAKDS